jgi:hypothetical protein
MWTGGTLYKETIIEVAEARPRASVAITCNDLNDVAKIVPADRIKSKNEHRVPLSERALEITATAAANEEEFVFPGGRWR